MPCVYSSWTNHGSKASLSEAIWFVLTCFTRGALILFLLSVSSRGTTGWRVPVSAIWSGLAPSASSWLAETRDGKWRLQSQVAVLTAHCLAHILGPITEDFSFIEIAMKLYSRLPGINVSLICLPRLSPHQPSSAELKLEETFRAFLSDCLASSTLPPHHLSVFALLWQFDRSLHCSEGNIW